MNPKPAERKETPSLVLALAIAAAAGGLALRICRWSAFHGVGFDENLYVRYLSQLMKVGLGGYPDIVSAYVEFQKTLPGSILPPTRFLYIFAAYIWHGAFGGGLLDAFKNVSIFFSVLTLVIAGLFAVRVFPKRTAACVFALMAFSPLQIHMAQHALVDGFFEGWALLGFWALWENLRAPDHRGWLATYALALAAMVLTKENAFFVFVGFVAILLANRWLGFGRVAPSLWGATALGVIIGGCALVFLAGGLRDLVGVYHLSVSKNMTLEYAIATGDGPWYRYLVDLMAFSPVVLILGLAAMLRLRREDGVLCAGAIFIAASYAIMCNLKYGMNLRYATIWDFPLRALAVAEIGRIVRQRADWMLGLCAALCALDVWQYWRLAVAYPLYELVPVSIMHALKMIK